MVQVLQDNIVDALSDGKVAGVQVQFNGSAGASLGGSDNNKAANIQNGFNGDV